MTVLTHIIEPTEVDDVVSLARFMHQRLGSAPLRAKDIPVVKKQLKEFFDSYPNAGWRALVGTVDWCRAKNKRPARTQNLFQLVPFAWSDKAIELRPPVLKLSDSLLDRLAAAIEQEDDPAWRRMLVGAQIDPPERARQILSMWEKSREVPVGT